MKKFAILALLGAACASEPAPRYAVQADVIAKSDLDGTWYFLQTMIGVPYSTGFTFIGEQGGQELEKIRWDIQEDVLTARRSYEFVRNTEKGEPSQNPGVKDYMGAPIAAFKIKSHFDIVRDYNASTGEELNKIVENTERKWYERKFIHVDWSENLISSFDFLAAFVTGSEDGTAIKTQPANYYVSDPNDPDAVRIERPSENESANYLEVTQKLRATPETYAFSDGTSYPICWFSYHTEDCASQELKVRNSFWKTTPRDYDPMVYDDHMMERFGFFTSDRSSYNRQYAETFSGLKRLINRYNIWQHTIDPDTAKTCQKDLDCGSQASGVRCDLALPDAKLDEKTSAVIGRCTLPYAVRNLEDPKPGSRDLGPRQIVYYLNDTFPKELIESAQKLADEYDSTLQEIYKSLVGSDAPSRMFTLCVNNPVVDGDPQECGPKGTHARIGDLRHSLIYWVDEPQRARLLGYGPAATDPETGEIIAGTAFVYGGSVDTYSAQARDIVELVNGDIKADQFVLGTNVKDWVNDNLNGPRSRPLSQAEVDHMADAMDLSWTAGLPKTPSLQKGSAVEMLKMARARSQTLSGSSLLGADPGETSRRLAKLKGTDIERKMVTGETLVARGIDPHTAADKVNAKNIAPLELYNPERSRQLRRMRNKLGSHGVDLAETVDDAVIGFAALQKGKPAEEVWRLIRAQVFRSTAEHEVGHTVGLRHNFAGSIDAMNYPKTYWDLRTANGHKPQPRYLDPESPAEQQGVKTPLGLQAGISEFQTSSIMDYGAKFNSDINGIGRYDRAALKFGYGQLVEVFNQVKDPYRLGVLQATATWGLAQPLTLDCKGNDYISVHYTTMPELVDLEDRQNVEFSKITMADSSKSCAYPDKVEQDAQKHFVVPYKFCSDEFEGAAVDCNTFDRGADVYEIAQNAISTYRNYYLFNNFARDRRGWNPNDYIDRIQSRYLDVLHTQMQFYVLFRADYADTIPDDGKSGNFWRSPTGWGPYTAAVTSGFNLLGEILTEPVPGPYYKYLQPSPTGEPRYFYQQNDYGTGNAAFTLNVPAGRYFTTEWDYDSGYYWYEHIKYIGSFHDKVLAMLNLADPETWFLGKDTATDVRQYAINYYRLFGQQMIETWAAALTDHWDRVAPVWDGTALKPRPMSDMMNAPKDGAIPIDPQIGFSVQLFAGVFGITLIPGTYDPTFFDSSRIWLLGNGHQILVSKPTVTFTDPDSGKIYEALTLKEKGVETGIGARMIARANELLDLVDKTDPATLANLRAYVQLLDTMRSVSEID